MAKEYTKEQIEKDIEALKKGKLSKSKLTLDFMDSYVAYFQPNKIEEYAKKCASITEKTREIKKEDSKDKGKKISVKDIKGVRDYFLETFFYEQSEKGLEEAKAEKKKAKEKEKAQKEAEKNMTTEERIKAKLIKIANNK